MTEADVCAAFLKTVPDDWRAYAETAGWDILLVHESGVQVGIEAKRTLNAKALAQALDIGRREADVVGPDYRAVLVARASAEMQAIAKRLGLAVLMAGDGFDRPPALPHIGRHNARWRTEWVDHWPLRRCPVPDYVPDVAAGAPAPVKLTEWKIKAAKVVILVERTGLVTAADFRALGLSMSTWSARRWLVKGARRGEWVRGTDWPADRFRAQHAQAFAKIEADWSRWSPRVEEKRQRDLAAAA